MLLVMNLSITEVFLNITYIIIFSCNILMTHYPSNSPAYQAVVDNTDMASATFLKLIYYLTMIYLALNKALEVILNIQYQTYCTKKNLKYLLGVTWILGIVFYIAIAISTYFYGFNSKETMNYFYTALDFIFLILATVTHGYIFHIYRQSRKDPQLTRSVSIYAKKAKQSIWVVFKNSRFYISALLIATFIFMVVVPKLVFFFAWNYIRKNKLVSIVFGTFIGVLYYISFTIDVLIYVFLHPQLKNLLWKKLKKIKYFNKLLNKDGRDYSASVRTELVSTSDL